jgi:bleomycin hydrolase
MYTVYWEFVEKARRFVARKGDSEFGRGSEPNAAIRIWKQYGLVPAAAYSGLSSGRQFYDDRRMMSEMRTYLASVKDRQDWNEDRAVATIKAIMDRHLGPPPTHVEVDGQTVTPQQYLQRMTGLDLDNYTCVISLMQMPYHQRCEYPVPDNWWHSTDYYNLPLDEFLKIIREAARIGQSLCLAVDNSEPGFLPRQDIAVVPSFDIPSAYIDDSARQCRFSNESTTDDHVVHMVGFHESNMDRWYLVKDSDTKPRNGHHQGYMFYHEDYLKLKALVILLPRDFAEKVLGRKLQ